MSDPPPSAAPAGPDRGVTAGVRRPVRPSAACAGPCCVGARGAGPHPAGMNGRGVRARTPRRRPRRRTGRARRRCRRDGSGRAGAQAGARVAVDEQRDERAHGRLGEPGGDLVERARRPPPPSARRRTRRAAGWRRLAARGASRGGRAASAAWRQRSWSMVVRAVRRGTTSAAGDRPASAPASGRPVRGGRPRPNRCRPRVGEQVVDRVDGVHHRVGLGHQELLGPGRGRRASRSGTPAGTARRWRGADRAAGRPGSRMAVPVCRGQLGDLRHRGVRRAAAAGRAGSSPTGRTAAPTRSPPAPSRRGISSLAGSVSSRSTDVCALDRARRAATSSRCSASGRRATGRRTRSSTAVP